VAGKKEPETITMTEYKNGDVLIESNISGGAFDKPFDLYYSSPKEIIDEITKKKIKIMILFIQKNLVLLFIKATQMVLKIKLFMV
jgi:hypothetical protein